MQLNESSKKYLETVRKTGIELVEAEEFLLWTGLKGGSTKEVGPLRGKKIGCLLASEFSDFQAYYVAAYIGELGGELEFLLVDRVTWHWTRPAGCKRAKPSPSTSLSKAQRLPRPLSASWPGERWSTNSSKG